MNPVSEQDVLEALKAVTDPDGGQDIVDLGKPHRMAGIDPGCAKTLAECSKCNFLWSSKTAVPTKSISY